MGKCMCLGMVLGVLFARADDSVRHILVMGDESRGYIHYLDQFNTNNSFSVKVPRPTWDMRACGAGKYRSVSGTGFTIVDLAQRNIVDQFSNPALSGLVTVCDVPGGGFLAGTNQKIGTPAKDAIVVYAFSADRQLIGKSVYAGVHYLRMMTRLDNGEILLAYYEGIIRGALAAAGTDAGNILQKYALPRGRNAYRAIPRQAGGYWVGAGYAAALYAYAADGTVVKTFEAKQPEGLKNVFYAQPVEMANGHLMVPNWCGHGPDDGRKGWQVIEFDAEGQVVWHLHDPVAYGSITGIDVLK